MTLSFGVVPPYDLVVPPYNLVVPHYNLVAPPPNLVVPSYNPAVPPSEHPGPMRDLALARSISHRARSGKTEIRGGALQCTPERTVEGKSTELAFYSPASVHARTQE